MGLLPRQTSNALTPKPKKTNVPARILFMGTPSFAVPSLAALLARPDICEVNAVVTQPDRPAGRGRKLTPSPVKVKALAHNLPIIQPTKIKTEETFQTLAQLAPELIVVAAYGRILPKTILELPEYGCINVHASLLPKYRGASPVAHAIMAGDARVGVGIMQMSEGLDTGDIHHEASIPLRDEHNRGNLTTELAELGAQALIECLPQILSGTSQPRPQISSDSSYAPLLNKQDGLLDFSLDARSLWLRIRGLTPWPGAFAYLADKRCLFIEVLPVQGSGNPGEVIAADSSGIRVACGEGALLVKQVQPAGKKPMQASAWVAGRVVSPGDYFRGVH